MERTEHRRKIREMEIDLLSIAGSNNKGITKIDKQRAVLYYSTLGRGDYTLKEVESFIDKLKYGKI